jgi:SRSO17 transposase
MVAWVDAWDQALERVHQHIGRHVRRPEPRQRMLRYLQALLSPCERKNGWQIAELAGDTTPDGMQRLLNAAHWDAEAVRDDLRTYVVDHLGDSQAVLIIDETGFLKQGTKSVGVHRQYSGTAGDVENCQIGVFLAYASTKGSAFIDRALYLPQVWTRDRSRRTEAHVPDTVAFATKPTLAIAMLDRAVAADVPFGWVTGDSVYGRDRPLRRWLEEHHRPYVLSVLSTTRLKQDAHWCQSAKQIAAALPADQWQRLSAGDGAQGPRWFDWAWQAVWWQPVDDDADGWGQWLLVRRSVRDPADLRYYIVFAPRAGTTLAQVSTVAGTRWQIEASFAAAKGECGLDQYEVRTWDAWHRHITLAVLAHAFLTVMRSQTIKKRALLLRTWCRSRCPRFVGWSGSWCGRGLQRVSTCWPGRAGAVGISSVPSGVIRDAVV